MSESFVRSSITRTAPVARRQRAHPRRRLDRAGHVVDRLEDADEVVAAGRLAGRYVALHEPHAVGEPFRLRVRPCRLDRGRVVVEAVHARGRVGARDLDARPAGAAGARAIALLNRPAPQAR
jgi:hypothetical protein